MRRVFGIRDEKSRTPADIDTVFRIASMTKSFTAMAVLKLRDEGKLSLEAPIASYLPEFSANAGPTHDSPPVTARLLLTHAGGLPWDDLWGPVSFGFSEGQLTAAMREGFSFSSTPGTRFEYSNLGYALLGQIVQRVSGKNLRDYVDAEILQPLGMSSTYWQAADVPPNHLAVGYREDDNHIAEPAAIAGAFSPVGGLYTSARDYAKYVALQLNAYPPRDDPDGGPVRRSTLREMHVGQRWARQVGNDSEPIANRTDGGFALSAASYGFGWFNKTTCDDEGRLEHSGWEPGYYSAVILLPRHGFAIFSLATTHGVRAIEGALGLIREAGVMPAPAEPAPSMALVAARDGVTRLLQQCDDALVQRIFDPTCANYPWFAHLREDLAKVTRDHGRCGQAGTLRAYGRLHGSWRLACERGAVEFDAGLSPASTPLLSRLWWKEDLPPDQRLTKVAARLVEAMNAGGGRVVEDLVAADLRSKALKTLGRLAVEHGTCSIERPLASDGRETATFRLQCADGPLELTFAVESKNGKVVELTGGRPHASDATCWQ